MEGVKSYFNASEGVLFVLAPKKVEAEVRGLALVQAAMEGAVRVKIILMKDVCFKHASSFFAFVAVQMVDEEMFSDLGVATGRDLDDMAADLYQKMEIEIIEFEATKTL